MLPTTTQSRTDFPALTAAEIAAAFGISKQAVKKKLRSIPATAKRTIAGNVADAWRLGELPPPLRGRLESVARSRGYESIGAMYAGFAKTWTPPVPMAEISDECLTAASLLQKALLPTLQGRRFSVSQADSERDGVADYEKVFGRKISARHFRSLIARTVQRDNALERFERLELYLPARPERKPEFVADPQQIFSALEMAIAEGAPADEIWEKAFSQLDRQADNAEHAARELREFLFSRAHLAPTRDALLKAWGRKFARWQIGATLDNRGANGADEGELTQQIKALGWFIPAARFFYLLTNRTEYTGSMPEAVRMTISLPDFPTGWPEALKSRLLKAIGQTEPPICPADLRETILARQKAFKSLVPKGIAKQIIVNPSIVKFSRSPRDWSLDNLSAPGSQRRYTNAAGERVIMQPGDWFGGDDSTPGIAVCVPCDEVITPCSQKFGVLLGRFQWLAYHDCRTDKVLAFDYIIRPRGSYRAEDILNGMGAVIKTHGVPRQGWQFEGGTFNAKLVQQTINLLGCEHWRTYSPHQKAIESIFNRVWTRLAVQFPHADMGRFRAENESNCKLYESAKAGHSDPRRYFPTLETVVKVFEEIIAEHNAKPIQSRQYGQWVPDSFFNSAVSAAPLRKFSPDMGWMFAPYTAERKVHGMMVSVSVPMFEDFSVPFNFFADWLPMYNGKKVRLHFNPSEPHCVAKVVLLENSGEHKAGEVLGDAQLIGETAEHIRFILNWGDDDQRAGYLARQKTGAWVRRETRGIGAGGRVEFSKSEERDGVSQVGIIELDAPREQPQDEKSKSQRRLAQNLSVVETTAQRAERSAEIQELERLTANLLS
jgi:hypothetical protein